MKIDNTILLIVGVIGVLLFLAIAQSLTTGETPAQKAFREGWRPRGRRYHGHRPWRGRWGHRRWGGSYPYGLYSPWYGYNPYSTPYYVNLDSQCDEKALLEYKKCTNAGIEKSKCADKLEGNLELCSA